MTGVSKARQLLLDRAATKNALLGIIKAYGEATLEEISAKYHSIAKAEGLPFWELTDQQIRATLNKALQEGLIHYQRVRVRGERYQKGRRYGTGKYFYGPQPADFIRQEKRGF